MYACMYVILANARVGREQRAQSLEHVILFTSFNTSYGIRLAPHFLR